MGLLSRLFQKPVETRSSPAEIDIRQQEHFAIPQDPGKDFFLGGGFCDKTDLNQISVAGKEEQAPDRNREERDTSREDAWFRDPDGLEAFEAYEANGGCNHCFDPER